MTSRREREEFLIRMDREGVPLDVARKLLRYGATLQRLAEAQCNGDWPADNGTRERKVVPCTRCETLWVRSSMVADKPMPGSNGFRPLICKDCRTEDLARAALMPYGLKPFFGGDPRGAVLSIVKADVPREAFESGRERGVCVPAITRPEHQTGDRG